MNDEYSDSEIYEEDEGYEDDEYSDDEYTEEEYYDDPDADVGFFGGIKRYMNRLEDAFTGIFIGILLMIGAVGFLFWNEGNSVKVYKSLKEGASAVISVSSETLDQANEGKLIHITGLADTKLTLTDSEFQVSSEALRLKRNVSMYQWKEEIKKTKKKKRDGSYKETKYRYKKTWSSSLINSSGFKKSSKYRNPGNMLYRAQTLDSDQVFVGAFKLKTSTVQGFQGFETLTAERGFAKTLAERTGRKVHESRGGYYIGENPSAPRIGDMIITFEQVKSRTLSIVAMQQGGTLTSYPTKVGEPVFELKLGVHNADAMFQAAQSSNTFWTWIFRLIGIILMIIGVNMLFRPLVVLADLIPIVGGIVEFGVLLISLIIGSSISFIVVAIAWIYYRPLLGIGLLIAAAALTGFAIKSVRSKKKMRPKQAKKQPKRKPDEQKKEIAEQTRAPAQKQNAVVDDPFMIENTTESSSISADDDLDFDFEPESAMTFEECIAKGQEAFKGGDFDTAVSLFTNAINQNSSSPAAYYNRGIAHNKLGNKNEFVSDFKNAAKLGHPKAGEFLTSKGISWE